MKLYATVTGLKEINGVLTPVSKGQGSNQSLDIEIIAEGLQGIPTRANVYRIQLNVGNDNELQADILDYSTGERTQLTGTCGHSEMAMTTRGCIDCEKGRRFL